MRANANNTRPRYIAGELTHKPCDFAAACGSTPVIRICLLLALVACHEPVTPPVRAEPRPTAFGVAFERILPSPARRQQPRFENGALVVGSTCWRGGQRLETCAKDPDGVTGRELSPNGDVRLHVEDDTTLVIQFQNEKATIEGVTRACWIDEQRIAWIDRGQLMEFDVRKRAKRMVGPITGELAACDAGRAALTTEDRLAVIDLTTRAELAHLDVHVDHVALARDKLAVISGHALVVMRQIGRSYVPELVRKSHEPFDALAFSPDGAQLALVGSTLVVLATGTMPQRAPDLPVADLPNGFAPAGVGVEWDYAQLSAPSGLAPLPAQLVRARSEFREVVTLAVDPATVSAKLATTEDDAIRAYALHVMPELFEQWANAKVETGKDAAFTLRVGRREGKPYFETRELWTDGCEPYDGYTQVVIEPDLLFVTRVLVPPGDTTNPWMQAFFDLPFQTRAKLARRRGPELGPC